MLHGLGVVEASGLFEWKLHGPRLPQPSPFKYIEYGVYGDLIIIYPKPYSIYLRRTIIVSEVSTPNASTSPDTCHAGTVQKLGYRLKLLEVNLHVAVLFGIWTELRS